MQKTPTFSLGFILGFTIIFLLLSIFASKLGGFISENMRYIKILFGIVMIILGLNYMEVLKIKALNQSANMKVDTKNLNFWKALLFGMIFSMSKINKNIKSTVSNNFEKGK